MTRSGLPKFYWLEAINSSIYILNKSLTHAIKDKTSEEVWIGWRPIVNYLWEFFGALPIPIFQTKKEKKHVNDKGEKYIFLVISDFSRSYKLCNHNTKKFVISQDIIFYEDTFWTSMMVPNEFKLW